MSKKSFLIPFFAAFLLVTACQDPSNSEPNPRAASEPPILSIRGTEILNKAKDGSSPVTLVDAWATWCTPCREKFPATLKLRETYGKQGLRVILISVDDPTDRKDVAHFLKEHKVSFPTYLRKGKDQEFLNSFHQAWSGTIPAMFIFDAEGKLKKFWEGEVDMDQVEQSIHNLLASKTKEKE